MGWLCVSWSVSSGRVSSNPWKITQDGSRATSESSEADLAFLITQLPQVFPKQEVGQAFSWVSSPASGLPSVVGLAGGLQGQQASWVPTQGQQGP